MEIHLGTLVHKRLDVYETLYGELGERLDVGSQRWVFADFEVRLVTRIEQVSDFLLVDLRVRDLNITFSMYKGGEERKHTSTVNVSSDVVRSAIRSNRASQMSGMIPRSAPYPIIL
jgi:hypothetical protein